MFKYFDFDTIKYEKILYKIGFYNMEKTCLKDSNLD